jgi:hypothetical protein
MTFPRLIAIVFIFVCVTVGWMILGSTVQMRTNDGYELLSEQVSDLWGSEQLQRAPSIAVSPEVKGEGLQPASSHVQVDLNLEPRRKGLLWYATYAVDFDGTYTIQNTLTHPVTATVSFVFPGNGAIYDDFEFRVGEVQATPGGSNVGELSIPVTLAPGEAVEAHVAYRSRGLDRWLYRFSDGITTLRDFDLAVTTNFEDVDFPAQTVSPTAKERTADGWRLTWQFNSMVTDADLGVEMPRQLNPGDLASGMSYFAPVSLLFFFTVLVVLGAVGGVNLHPMHYFFLAAAFFSFHLLFAYLADHLMVELAFSLAALVSLGLAVSYTWRVAGRRFALREVGLSQFFFLVLFSAAFFLEGYTGLVVTVGAIVTLAILMQVTAKVDWGKVFGKKEKAAAAGDGPAPAA